MSKITRCDICGRTSLEAFNIDRYKLKKEVCGWHERSWQKLDICTDCIDEIRAKVRARKAGIANE